jgi:hypothetical protein
MLRDQCFARSKKHWGWQDRGDATQQSWPGDQLPETWVRKRIKKTCFGPHPDLGVLSIGVRQAM